MFVLSLSGRSISPSEVIELCGGSIPAVKALLQVVRGDSSCDMAVAAGALLVSLSLPEAHFVGEVRADANMRELCAHFQRQCNGLIKVCVDEAAFDVLVERLQREKASAGAYQLFLGILSRLVANTMEFSSENTGAIISACFHECISSPQRCCQSL